MDEPARPHHTRSARNRDRGRDRTRTPGARADLPGTGGAPPGPGGGIPGRDPAGAGGVADRPARGRDDDRATAVAHHDGTTVGGGEPARAQRLAGDEAARLVGPPARIDNPEDRKSTRLNSSH